MLGPLLALLGYLVGSVSFALLAARRAGIDLREAGSGNLGATNVGRALGKRTGRIVLALDAAKGAGPALLAATWIGLDAPWTAATGCAAVLGHCFPVWHGFRGGKGAATAAGVTLALVPPAGALATVVYLGLKRATGRASIGSLAGCTVGCAASYALLGAGPRAHMTLAILTIVTARHAGNLRRLLAGTEPRE